MSAEWKQNLCNCAGDCEICCCVSFCSLCQNYRTAENLGKSGLVYTLLFCLFPCIPILLLRQEARERYNIEGSTADDAITSFCCTSCVMCQTAAEIKNRGDSD